ncbi:hypothetical protein ACPA9J_03870 [Pseudomonas aeruginosa]
MAPPAFTKIYAMLRRRAVSDAADSLYHGLLIRGRIPDEQKNPITRILTIAAYRPAPEGYSRRPATLLIAVLALATTACSWRGSAGEFAEVGRRGPALHALGPAGTLRSAPRSC